MSVQLTVEQEVELAKIARVTERTADEVAQEAVAQFLLERAEHRAAIAESREQIAQGQTIPHEEVVLPPEASYGLVMQVRWTPAALTDLEESIDFIEPMGQPFAQRIATEI